MLMLQNSANFKNQIRLMKPILGKPRSIGIFLLQILGTFLAYVVICFQFGQSDLDPGNNCVCESKDLEDVVFNKTGNVSDFTLINVFPNSSLS